MAWPDHRAREIPPPRRRAGPRVFGKYPVPPKHKIVEPYLGDVVDMADAPLVFRRALPHEDFHWAKRAVFVVCGVLLVWWGLIAWVALP